MKFSDSKNRTWTKMFAWRRVFINNNDSRWLEFVEKRDVPEQRYNIGFNTEEEVVSWHTEYRVPEDE